MTGSYTLRPLRTEEEFRACIALQRETWGEDFGEVVPATILKVVQFVGGVAAGAFDAEDRLVGFVFGVSGVRDGRLAHWSDMLAVRRELRDRGLGERLKRYQRELLLPLGIRTVLWTFDPLESRNAYLNLTRLGAVAREYRRDVYGESGSPLHRGVGTDRLIAEWEIDSPRVRARLDGDTVAPGPADMADAPLCNPTREGGAGLESAEPDLSLDAERIRLAIPVDLQALKERAPELAVDWRRKTRLAFEAYFARGYVAVELVREAGRSCYVLERSDRAAFLS